MHVPAGTVAALWRYPVKSMQGEALDAAPCGADGVLGDRAYAVVERDGGRVASAKHPRKWGRLLACRAAFVEPPRPGAAPPPVAITLPDGAVVASDDPAVGLALSRLLGHPVRLVSRAAAMGEDANAPRVRETDRTPLDADGAAPVLRDEPLALAAPAGTFFDVAPLHLLTAATLDALAARAPASRFDVRRFRPNLVVRPTAPVQGALAAFPENDWIGCDVRVGSAVRLRVTDPTPRCVVTTLGAADLPHDPDVLRTIARWSSATSRTLAPGVRFDGVAGAYAVVLAGGWLRRGEPVHVLRPEHGATPRRATFPRSAS